MNLRFQREGEFGVGAAQCSRRVDAVARFYFLNAIADGFDDAGGVRSRRVRQRRLDGIGAGAHIGVVGIDAGGVDFYQDLAGCGFGRWDFVEFQLFRAAELVDTNRLHCGSPQICVTNYFLESSKNQK